MVGRQISKYRILEKVGQGGAGQVYRAQDLALQRPVAIKFLHPTVTASEEQRQRFEQEALAISSLNHAHIAVLYDAPEIDGERFIVFEYLAGGSLRERVVKASADAKFLPFTDVVRFGEQIAGALAHAHSHGIIHRDLKTSNVMLTAEQEAKVTDFGLAKMEAAEPITELGQAVGTVAYMAPEQALGERVDARSDIFSMGVVLYELITLQRPFAGASQLELLRSVIEDQPLSPQELRPTPPQLERVVLKCLEKKPERRYQTAAELQTDLRHIALALAATEQTDAEPSTISFTTGRRFSGRKAFWLSAMLLALVVLLAGWWLRNELGKGFGGGHAEKRVAVLRFESIGKQSLEQEFCAGLMETLTSELTQLERFQNSLSIVPSADIRKEDVESVRDARKAFGVNLVVTGSVQRSGSGLHLTMNLIDAQKLKQIDARELTVSGDDLAALQTGVLKDVAELLDLEVRPQAAATLAEGNTSNPDAYKAYILGSGYLLGGKEQLSDAIANLEKAVQLDPRYASAYATLARAYYREYSVVKNRGLLDEAWEACRKALALAPNLPAAHITLSVLYSGTGKYEDAIRESDAVLKLDRLNSAAHDAKATALMHLERRKEAEAELKESVQLRPDYWNGFVRLGSFYVREGRYAEAEQPFQRAASLVPENAAVWANLGALYHLQGRDAEAETMFRKALDLKPTPETYSNLGTAYFFQGRYGEAAREFEKAVGPNQKDYTIWGNLGDAYRWSGDGERAKAANGRAIGLAEAALAVNARDFDAISSLGLYEAKAGDGDGAMKATQTALASVPGSSQFLFNAAIVYAILGHEPEALQYLKMAIKDGYSRYEIKGEPELRNLRRDPEVASLLAANKQQ